MVFSKKVTLKLQVKCTIHDRVLRVATFYSEEPHTSFSLQTSICPVDDGCEPEYYRVEESE